MLRYNTIMNNVAGLWSSILKWTSLRQNSLDKTLADCLVFSAVAMVMLCVMQLCVLPQYANENPKSFPQ